MSRETPTREPPSILVIEHDPAVGQPIVDQLSRTITDILKRPVIKDAWEKQGASPMVMTQAVFTAFMESEIAKWAKVIQANHIALIN